MKSCLLICFLIICFTFISIKVFGKSKRRDIYYHNLFLLDNVIKTESELWLCYTGSGIPECDIANGNIINGRITINDNNQIIFSNKIYTFTYDNKKTFFNDWSFINEKEN